MSEVSPVYSLTEHVHDSFLAKNSLLTDAEIAKSNVNLDFEAVTHNTTERLRIVGKINGRSAYQSLAKDKQGIFHLSTVFTDYKGPHFQHDIKATTAPELVDTIAESLFMQALIKIAFSRGHNH